VQACPFEGVVDDPLRGEQRPANRTRNAESFSLPERLARLADHANGVDHRAAAKSVERPGEAVRDDGPFGHAALRTEPHSRGP